MLFLVIGVMAGMFGIGAGWANVPALNLLMGAPLKSFRGAHRGWCCRCVGLIRRVRLPEPRRGVADDRSALGGGHDAGSTHRSAPAPYDSGFRFIRKMVIALLLPAGIRALLKGLGLWV